MSKEQIRLSEKPLHEQLADQSKSAFQRYQDLALGTNSIWYLVKYELIMLISSWVPGALGLVLRKFLYPFILGEVGRNVIIGRGVSIRHGEKITLGDNVVLDDQVLLDAKGSSNKGIQVGSNSIISRNVVLSCKNGDIKIGQWLGSSVQVLDGIEIETGSIIGTSSVVNKNVDSYSVVAGVPGKVIKTRTTASD